MLSLHENRKKEKQKKKNKGQEKKSCKKCFETTLVESKSKEESKEIMRYYS